MAMLSLFFVLFFCNSAPKGQIMPHAASIYVKLRSLARGSSPQCRRRVGVGRLAPGLAPGHEFTRKRRYSWLQPCQTSGSDSATGPTPATARSCCPTRRKRQPSRVSLHSGTKILDTHDRSGIITCTMCKFHRDSLYARSNPNPLGN